MTCRSLADFVEELGRAGELVRIEAEVDPALEIAEITRCAARKDSPALLFAAIKGHHLPVLTNLLGTDGRICRALGVDSVEERAERVARLIQSPNSEGWLARLGMGTAAAGPLAGLASRRVKSAACQQIIRLASDVDLGQLPLLQSAVQELRPIITAAAVITAEPDTHRQIAGRFDLEMLGRDRLAVCWTGPDEPARLLDGYRRRAERMPLAVVLGGHPAIFLAASALLPGADPLALAGLLREKALDSVSCRTVDLQVPAEADIVIEGYVDAAEPLIEAGPRASPLGYCTSPQAAPHMYVTAITHRANPIFPAMVQCGAHAETCIVDRALARIFLPLAKLAIPELLDFDLPLAGAARHLAVLAIRKTYAGQARRVASAAWAMRQFLFAKMLVVVDERVDVRDPGQVVAAIAANVNPGRDVFFQQGPADPLDPASPPGVLGQRMALDATAKLLEEHGGRWPERADAGEAVRRMVSERWAQYGLGPMPGDG
jgi:4-hydroxy-3-polyprenylbenzoate decarboxylase